MKLKITALLALIAVCTAAPALAQNEHETVANIGGDRESYIGKVISFDISQSNVPPETSIEEVSWNFGDSLKATGEKVSHAYSTPGTFTVTLTIQTNRGTSENKATVRVFKHVAILVADSVAPEDQLQTARQEAAKEDVLLLVIRSQGGGPEAVTEEELTNQLLDVRDAVPKTDLIIAWTSGSVGANVLSKFAQHIKQTQGLTQADINMESKAVILLSDTRFGVLAPVAQSAFDQLRPAYILLTKPEALPLLLTPLNPDEAKAAMLNSALPHQLLGTFSSRTVRDIGPTNFMSFGLNFLVNRGVPINNITLILMLPIIATILSFSRQVIGIKAFGIITPALTTLTFLVMGLQYGLIVFATVLLSGTLTRLAVRRLHLLYLPRMALVLTSVSVSILILLGFGVATEATAVLSFSIFPILILTLLAEEFIAVQFTSGARSALTITAWTLLLSIACYYIVSWELLRTIVISYPEVIILGIPINILLGRWSGLRVTEYFRFRKLLRYSQ